MFRRFGACWLALLLTVPAAVGLNKLIAANDSEATRITPELPELLPFVLWGVPFVWFVVVAVRTMLTAPSWRWRFVFKALGAHVALTLTSIVLAGVVSFWVIGLRMFEPSWTGESTQSRNGTVGYLYTAGLFCGYHVYERKPWSITLSKTETVDTSNCDHRYPPELVWNADRQELEVVLTNPEEKFRVGGVFDGLLPVWGGC